MKIALIGYGKMGKVIEEIALSGSHEVVSKIDVLNTRSDHIENIKNADVAFEFTKPEAAVSNILKCFKLNIPVVCGTTGWYDNFEFVENECKKYDGTLFHASNFSLGVNILFELNHKLALIMNNFSEYDIGLTEIHHLQKLDSPSGTAITLAKGILDNLDRKDKWVNNKDAAKTEINIISKREEKVPGTHTIKYESNVDKLEITHSAKNRMGFGSGAILAGEFIQGKKGIFTMQDLLKL